MSNIPNSDNSKKRIRLWLVNEDGVLTRISFCAATYRVERVIEDLKRIFGPDIMKAYGYVTLDTGENREGIVDELIMIPTTGSSPS